MRKGANIHASLVISSAATRPDASMRGTVSAGMRVVWERDELFVLLQGEIIGEFRSWILQSFYAGRLWKSIMVYCALHAADGVAQVEQANRFEGG